MHTGGRGEIDADQGISHLNWLSDCSPGDSSPEPLVDLKAAKQRPFNKPLSIGHSDIHKQNQQQSDHNQDHPHNRPNNQTGHVSKGVGSMIAYYEYLSGYSQDYR